MILFFFIFIGNYTKYLIKIKIIDLHYKCYLYLQPDREVLPPITKRPPGRPRMARRRDADEPAPSKQRRCGNCHQLGHNKKRCNMGGTKFSASTRKKVKTRGAFTQTNQRGHTEGESWQASSMGPY